MRLLARLQDRGFLASEVGRSLHFLASDGSTCGEAGRFLTSDGSTCGEAGRFLTSDGSTRGEAGGFPTSDGSTRGEAGSSKDQACEALKGVQCSVQAVLLFVIGLAW